MAKFYNYNIYKLIVTAAVYPGLYHKLTPINWRSPTAFNLRALGRCHPLYFVFRLSRELCFC